MNDIVSIWRSPLDKVALAQTEAVCEREPRCSSGIQYYTNFNLMTIYNFGYYVTEYPTSNDDALSHMFADMQGASPIGGVAFIPQVEYTLDSSSAGFGVPDQCQIVGSGGGGRDSGATFYHFKIEGTGGSGGGAGNVFLSCAGQYTTGGRYFRSLAFHWESSENERDTCISAGTFNCRVVNCTFTDCPIAFHATGPSCALEQCTIDYTTGPPGATAVIIAGPQCAIRGPCALLQKSVSAGGPMECTCVSIEYGAEHTVIANVHLSDWTTGVDFSQSQGSLFTEVRNCEMQCDKTAINVQLPVGSVSAGTIGVKVTSCTLAKSQDSSDPGPIVNVDSRGAQNSLLEDISLVDCTVFSQSTTQYSGQHGLEIVGGTNVKVIGGTYSNNGSGTGAGIAITGPCGDVQIIGANLQPTDPNSQHVYSQQYALLVSGGPIGKVLVSDCDMTGYSPASPVSVTGTPPSELLITNCQGVMHPKNETGS